MYKRQGENNLRTVRFEKISSFNAHCFGHCEDYFVSARRRNRRKTYTLSLIHLFALIGIILMMRRKIAGANMYLMSAIALIIVSMLAYNKIINTIGYYSSVISLMNTIGSGYSKFIALCVAYPIFMYMMLAFLKSKGEVSAKN